MHKKMCPSHTATARFEYFVTDVNLFTNCYYKFEEMRGTRF